jgi:hypothetical protein
LKGKAWIGEKKLFLSSKASSLAVNPITGFLCCKSIFLINKIYLIENFIVFAFTAIKFSGERKNVSCLFESKNGGGFKCFDQF